MRNSALININMTHAAADAGRRALLLLLLGLRLPRHGAGRAGDDRGARPTPRSPTTSTAGRSSTPSAWPWPTAGATAWRCASPASRTATAPRAPGRGGREKAPAAICRKVAEAAGRRHDRGLGRRHRHALLHLRRRHGRRHLPADALRPRGRRQHRLPEYVTVDELVAPRRRDRRQDDRHPARRRPGRGAVPQLQLRAHLADRLGVEGVPEGWPAAPTPGSRPRSRPPAAVEPSQPPRSPR